MYTATVPVPVLFTVQLGLLKKNNDIFNPLGYIATCVLFFVFQLYIFIRWTPKHTNL